MSGLTNRIARCECDRTPRIELLVVIIIIGILAAIALPSFLNQAAKAKQSEAKTYVGSANRAQQTYRIERTRFASTIAQLEIGIPTQTIDYKYTIELSNEEQTVFTGRAIDVNTTASYAGGVSILPVTGSTSAATCQTTSPSGTPPKIVFNETETTCETPENNMR